MRIKVTITEEAIRNSTPNCPSRCVIANLLEPHIRQHFGISVTKGHVRLLTDVLNKRNHYMYPVSAKDETTIFSFISGYDALPETIQSPVRRPISGEKLERLIKIWKGKSITLDIPAFAKKGASTLYEKVPAKDFPLGAKEEYVGDGEAYGHICMEHGAYQVRGFSQLVDHFNRGTSRLGEARKIMRSLLKKEEPLTVEERYGK